MGAGRRRVAAAAEDEAAEHVGGVRGDGRLVRVREEREELVDDRVRAAARPVEPEREGVVRGGVLVEAVEGGARLEDGDEDLGDRPAAHVAEHAVQRARAARLEVAKEARRAHLEELLEDLHEVAGRVAPFLRVVQVGGVLVEETEERLEVRGLAHLVQDARLADADHLAAHVRILDAPLDRVAHARQSGHVRKERAEVLVL